MTDLNLFALTNIPGRRILRLPLASDVQREISAELLRQEAAFSTCSQEEISFDGKYKPDENECLVIADYNDIDDLHGAIANPLSISEIDPSPSEFFGIKALFSGYQDISTGVKIALIQNFDRRKIISNSGFSLFYSENVYKKVDGIGITINTNLSAVLADSTLKFFNFFGVRQIFDLSAYFNEATDADINAFAAMSEINVPNIPAFLAMADSWVRRKVAFIAQSQILQKVSAAGIVAAAVGFNIQIQTTNVNGKDVIILPNNKTDLKKLLRFLDEDYYQSTLLSQNYLSNSRRRV